MSFKTLAIAATALGFTGITPQVGGAWPGTRTGPAIVAPVPVPALPEPGRAVTLVKAPDGLFYVTARVNGTPVRFVVDTGANVVVLTNRDASAAGLQPARHRARIALRTAGGRRTTRWASIARLGIAGQVVENTEAVIADGGPTHSLLGQSALARFESVTLRGDRLELKI